MRHSRLRKFVAFVRILLTMNIMTVVRTVLIKPLSNDWFFVIVSIAVLEAVSNLVVFNSILLMMAVTMFTASFLVLSVAVLMSAASAIVFLSVAVTVAVSRFRLFIHIFT